jgi:hypothetical protein
MAYTSSAAALRDLAYTAATPAKARPGFFARLLASMQAARLRQAEREIAHYLADTGGKFTDESEREIERRFLSAPTHW